MEYKTEFTILLPEKLTAALDINEDTLFETYFDDGKIKVPTSWYRMRRKRRYGG